MTKAEIQLIRSLDDRRGRDETGLFVAEGSKLVGEILASGLRVRKLYFTGHFEEVAGGGWHPATGNAAPAGRGGEAFAGVESERISPREMERASRLKTPTECLALVEIPQRTLDTGALRGRLVLALDEVQNPGNMGTIMRLADWFGITDILCSEGMADCFNPKVVQATMGAIARVRVHYGNLGAMIAAVSGTASATETAEAAGAEGAVGAMESIMPVYGTFLEGDDIRTAPLTPGGIVVLGSEGRGISPAIERHVTRKLFIPPYPQLQPHLSASDDPANTTESLNVAIAAAIVCWEFRRRTK